jgi:hypothetical protein
MKELKSESNAQAAKENNIDRQSLTIKLERCDSMSELEPAQRMS